MLLTLLGTASARADSAHSARSGGASVKYPAVTGLKCTTGEKTRCPRGSLLRLSGVHLDSTRTVVFLGKRGKRDDRRVRPRTASPHRVLVRVPSRARSGRVRVIASAISATSPRLRILPKPTPPPLVPTSGPLAGVFPIRGEHDYGTAINRFGAGRGHQGQDVLADCATPLVAAVAGTVTSTRYHSAAGNYVVITSDDGTSQVYMHMLKRATVKRGRRVAAGDPLGEVGQTGRASACHLHFELWTAPGWRAGGAPVDPLRLLKALDFAS